MIVLLFFSYSYKLAVITLFRNGSVTLIRDCNPFKKFLEVVKRTFNAIELRTHDVSVDFRRLYIFMAKQGLHHSDISTIFEHMCCERMTECM